MTPLLFYAFAALSIISALLIITHRHPVYSALFLILTFFALAVLYVLLNAQFIAAVHVVVYAGAIMVLFLFVIMLLNLRRETLAVQPNWVWKGVGGALAVLLLIEVGYVLNVARLPGGIGPYSPEVLAQKGNTELIGELLFTRYVFPFEVASVVLLVAIVGAIVLSKRKLS